MNRDSLAVRIKKANREVYSSISPEEYNKNESLFNERRELSCRRILSEIAGASGTEMFLDIGTGTGNLLRIAQEYFRMCVGGDISENLLSKIKEQFPKCYLIASDAENLPFKNNQFNCVSCYALLHHLYEHEKLFRECHRILKDRGALYTDHDPNYFFNRFYHIYYKIRYSKKHGFGNETGDFAEYHNVFSAGINPEKLKILLLNIGFKKVEINYRITDRENWGGIQLLTIEFLRMAKKILPLKSFNTHFSIVAIK